MHFGDLSRHLLPGAQLIPVALAAAEILCFVLVWHSAYSTGLLRVLVGQSSLSGGTALLP